MRESGAPFYFECSIIKQRFQPHALILSQELRTRYGQYLDQPQTLRIFSNHCIDSHPVVLRTKWLKYFYQAVWNPALPEKAQYSQYGNSSHTAMEKFENATIFLWIDLLSKLIRPKNRF